MHSVQEYQLPFQKKQENQSETHGIEKVLQALQKNDLTQGN